MEKEKCHYWKSCGSQEICKGCEYDPNKSVMTLKEFKEDIVPDGFNCRNCELADKGKCKRLDHERHKFSKGIFASYTCGRDNGTSAHLCPEFQPVGYYVQLQFHYKPEFVTKELERRNKLNPLETVSLIYDEDFDVRYEVWASDFVNNTFLNEDGTYKWLRKGYSKQKRVPAGEFNYEYVYEYPDGYIQHKANQPLLMEHIPEELRKEV